MKILILSLLAYITTIWLGGSYIFWDMDWFLSIGDWSIAKRVVFMFIMFITITPFIAIPCGIEEDRKNERR